MCGVFLHSGFHPPVAAPDEEDRQAENREPDEQNRAVFLTEEHKSEQHLRRVAHPGNECVMDAVRDGGRRRVELRFVILDELEFDACEVHAVFEGLLLGFHLFDLATDAGDLFFDLEDVFDLSGALLEDGAQALFGFAGVLEARNQIGVLLGDFLAGLRLVFDAADGFEIGKSGGEFGSRDAQRGLKGAFSAVAAVSCAA